MMTDNLMDADAATEDQEPVATWSNPEASEDIANQQSVATCMWPDEEASDDIPADVSLMATDTSSGGQQPIDEWRPAKSTNDIPRQPSQFRPEDPCDREPEKFAALMSQSKADERHSG
jgi:hypothetical protein